jgi:hypothetical protein
MIGARMNPFDERMQRTHAYAPCCCSMQEQSPHCWGCGRSKDDPIHAVEETA